VLAPDLDQVRVDVLGEVLDDGVVVRDDAPAAVRDALEGLGVGAW